MQESWKNNNTLVNLKEASNRLETPEEGFSENPKEEKNIHKYSFLFVESCYYFNIEHDAYKEFNIESPYGFEHAIIKVVRSFKNEKCILFLKDFLHRIAQFHKKYDLSKAVTTALDVFSSENNSPIILLGVLVDGKKINDIERVFDNYINEYDSYHINSQLKRFYKSHIDFEKWGLEYSFDVESFEKALPHNIRCKYCKIVSYKGFQVLYWVTQEDIYKKDIYDFKDALKGTPYKKALVICRNDTYGSFLEDIDNPEAYKIGRF